MTGAEATILLIFVLWAIVITCFIVSSLADRKRRRARVARLERERAEARAQRRSQAPYQWPKAQPIRQEFAPLTMSAVIEATARANGVTLPRNGDIVDLPHDLQPAARYTDHYAHLNDKPGIIRVDTLA